MNTTAVTVSRLIQGPPEAVYDAWLDPKSPGGLWFGVERAILNVAVDGLYFHAVRHEGRSWAHYGRFIALERGRRIEQTWVSEATKGLESIVTVTLEAKAAGTEVTLRHVNIPDDEMGRSHQDGWTWCLDALAGRFSETSRP
jgi:uncharacterized protein YndB with AHSA1/START domain